MSVYEKYLMTKKAIGLIKAQEAEREKEFEKLKNFQLGEVKCSAKVIDAITKNLSLCMQIKTALQIHKNFDKWENSNTLEQILKNNKSALYNGGEIMTRYETTMGDVEITTLPVNCLDKRHTTLVTFRFDDNKDTCRCFDLENYKYKFN